MGSVALASAAPVVVMVPAVLAVLPALATAGDVLVARRHSAGRRFYAGAMVPLRAVRNIGWSLLRGLPALGVGVVLVAIAVAVDQLEGPVAARDAIVRAAGVLTMVLVGRPALDPDRRLRAAAVTDVVLQGVVDTGGRLQPRGWWVWFGALVATALGLYWQPELWPLPVCVSVPNRRFVTESWRCRPSAAAQRPRRETPLRRFLWGLCPQTPSGSAADGRPSGTASQL